MNEVVVTASRQTKYLSAVFEALQMLEHATNVELLEEVRKTYPKVSATTIHRVSARLRERGVIGYAPKPADGSERYDINPHPHHHFICTDCSRVCDVPATSEARAIIGQLKNLSGECALAGTLTMQGICQRCVSSH